MRIALDCRSVFPGRGGIGRYAECLAQRLPALDPGNDYLFLTTSRQTEPLAPAPNVVQLPVPAGMIDSWWEQLQLPGLLREYGVALYHNPCFALPVVASCRWRVATVHDVVFRARPELVEPQLRRYLDEWTEHAVGAADALLTVSAFSRDELVKHYQADAAKVHVVPNGVGAAWRPARAADQRRIRREYQLPETFVLYLGSLEPKKNLNLLLAAQAQLAAAGVAPLLVLAGARGGPEYDLPGAIQRRGLAELVRVLGYVPEAAVAPLLSAATLFVYPSHYEGFGLPPLEALACGTPVIVAEGSSLGEVVGPAGVVVPPTDPAALAAAMRRLLDDDAARRELAARGRERAAGFTWEATAQGTLQVYRGLTGGAR